MNQKKDSEYISLQTDHKQISSATFLKKTNKRSEGIKKGSLSRKETYISLKTGVSKTITYSFTATSLDEKDLHKISTPVYKTALPRMGILPTLPLPYRYASSRYQGIDMPHLPVEQIIKKGGSNTIPWQSNLASWKEYDNVPRRHPT